MRNVFVTTAGVFYDGPLMCPGDSLGKNSVMFSVDNPFKGMSYASAWLDAATIPQGLEEKVSCRDAEALLEL